MDSKAEAEFIQEGIKECIDEGLVLKNQKLNRGSMVVAAGESMGVYIYGRYEENRFVYEYHFPFLMGSVGTLNDEITIERHLDKESFAAVCDEAKTGVTLIFYLQNIMDYLDYLVKAAGNQKLPELLDTRGASVKNPVPGKRAVMTALSIGGMILLPIRKKQEKDKEAEESQYSVMGEILELSEVRNTYTDEKVYQMTLECNNMVFRMAINEADLMGEPAVGRRFKGQVWLQGRVQF